MTKKNKIYLSQNTKFYLILFLYILASNINCQMWERKGYQISISHWRGRLGNNIIQLCCALFIAEQTNSVLRYPKHTFVINKVFDFKINGQQNCNKRIKATFFGPHMLHNLEPLYTEMTRVNISRKYITPLLKILSREKWTPLSPKADFDTTLVVHIRSGDAMKQGTNKSYVQPPLSCYKKVILDSGVEFSHVLIVTERDMRNPTVNALKKFCKSKSISCYIQRGSVQLDVTTIVRAKYFITAHSSFSWSFLRCNKDCITVFKPNIRHPDAEILPANPAKLPYKQYFYGFPGYICVGQWLYTPEQLKLMIDYPAQKIPVKIVEKL